MFGGVSGCRVVGFQGCRVVVKFSAINGKHPFKAELIGQSSALKKNAATRHFDKELIYRC